MMNSASEHLKRSAIIDIVKALASQIIALHHLVLYSPMTDWLTMKWPQWVDFIYDNGRLAVQPFLVIGGFLTAQSVSKQHNLAVGKLIWERYWRLAPPLFMALILVVIATVCLGKELAHKDWLSPVPSLGTFLAHLFFLQDILEIPSLSAGAWYVAIDFQMFALFVLLARMAGQSKQPLSESLLPAVIAAFTIASIHIFSRQEALDVWCVYYFSAYGLGAMVAWARDSVRARMWLWFTVVILLADWITDPRSRPILALITAFGLYSLSQVSWRKTLPALRKYTQYLSDVSYSMFVTHFAVIILVSGLWEKFDLKGVGLAGLLFIIAWMSALAFGIGVHHLCGKSMLRLRFQNKGIRGQNGEILQKPKVVYAQQKNASPNAGKTETHADGAKLMKSG